MRLGGPGVEPRLEGGALRRVVDQGPEPGHGLCRLPRLQQLVGGGGGGVEITGHTGGVTRAASAVGRGQGGEGQLGGEVLDALLHLDEPGGKIAAAGQPLQGEPQDSEVEENWLGRAGVHDDVQG